MQRWAARSRSTTTELPGAPSIVGEPGDDLVVRELITVDNGSGAEFISPTPWCVIHGRHDDFCSPEDADGRVQRAAEPKVFHWLETTNHIDLYDNPTFTGPATSLAIEWLRQHLL